MATFTVQKLIDRAKAAADMHDDFVKQSQWIDWLNVERLNLERLVAQAGYVLAETPVTIVADGSESYPISPEPLAVLAVYEVEDERYRRLRSDNIFDGQALRDPSSYRGEATKFRITQGDGQLAIAFHPRPTSGTYVAITIAAPATVTTVDDTVSYPLGWEERIVLGLARRALAKEETINPSIEAQIREIEAHIEETAWNRLWASSGARVRNVDKVERGWRDAPEVPPRDYWVFV